jgi:hypothetical protein
MRKKNSHIEHKIHIEERNEHIRIEPVHAVVAASPPVAFVCAFRVLRGYLLLGCSRDR